MPRKQKYDDDILLDWTNQIKPIFSEMWDDVAIKYQKHSEELLLRESTDLKRHFQEKLCNKMQVITGTSRSAINTHSTAQGIHKKKLQKTRCRQLSRRDKL